MAGAISVSGLSTGLDTGSIVSKLIELKRRPIDVISAKKDLFDVKLSEFQNLNLRLLNFQSIVENLKKSDSFLTKTGTFSNNNASDNNNVVGLIASSTAASGSFSLVVNSLAIAEKEVSEGFASTSSSVSTGTFSITVGSTTTDITIDSSNNTLAGLKSAINASGADVTASILNDGSGTDPYRLSITSNNAGTDNTLTISHTPASIFTLGGSGPIPSGAGLTFTENQSATDASLTLDGISITKSTNSITDIIDGVTIDLSSVGSGTITIASNANDVKTNIEKFVSEYNDLISFINDQFFFNNETGQTGILFGNTTVINLQSTMRDIIADEVPGLTGTYTTLAQVGITTNSISGNLVIDDGDLTDALNTDIDAVTKLFIGNGSSDTSGLSFAGFTEDTEGGTYDVQVSNGQVQIAASGATSFTNAEGSGNFYSGPAGTAGEGLRFGLTSLTDGDKGTITFSFGVAANFDRILDDLTDKSKEGPLRSELDTLMDNIEDLEDVIENQEARLLSEEEMLTRRFATLESFVSKMQSQGDFLAQIQSGLLASVKK
tara:strand:+ start:3628 stop:5274 length:1647 start_codon:yes stop_codon:yes gene_type:complete